MKRIRGWVKSKWRPIFTTVMIGAISIICATYFAVAISGNESACEQFYGFSSENLLSIVGLSLTLLTAAFFGIVSLRAVGPSSPPRGNAGALDINGGVSEGMSGISIRAIAAATIVLQIPFLTIFLFVAAFSLCRQEDDQGWLINVAVSLVCLIYSMAGVALLAMIDEVDDVRFLASKSQGEFQASRERSKLEEFVNFGTGTRVCYFMFSLLVILGPIPLYIIVREAIVSSISKNNLFPAWGQAVFCVVILIILALCIRILMGQTYTALWGTGSAVTAAVAIPLLSLIAAVSYTAAIREDATVSPWEWAGILVSSLAHVIIMWQKLDRFSYEDGGPKIFTRSLMSARDSSLEKLKIPIV